MTVTIYALIDPTTQQVRYVGRTSHTLNSRLSGHMGEKTNRAKNKWISTLKSQGLRPTITELEKCEGDSWAEAETRWIAHFKAIGSDLVNASEGGELNRLHQSKMVRMAVTMPPRLAEWLTEEAETRQVSISEVLRDAVDSYIDLRGIDGAQEAKRGAK